MGVARTRWMQFWFAPQHPVDLAVCRILFFGALVALYLPRDFALWASVSSAFWMPTALFEIFAIPVATSAVLNVLQIVWKLALLLSCLGLFTRPSTITCFMLGFYLLGLPHNMGKVHHFDTILVFIFGIMMCARCGDSWSLDQWLWRRSTVPVAPSGEYRWPIRAVWLMFGLVFFAAGVAKLRNAGLAWVFSDNLARTLLKEQYGGDPMVDWGVAIAQHWWLYQPLAGTTVLLELAYPLALFSRRVRWLVVPGMLVAQIGIRVLLGPSFEQYILANVFWVPWSALFGLLSWRTARPLSRPEDPTPESIIADRQG